MPDYRTDVRPDYGIDFTKVDHAFQSLVDSPEGSAALEQLQAALDRIGSAVRPQLNRHEVQYLLVNLVQQRQGAQAPGIVSSAPSVKSARVKSGFLIKTAVPE